MVPTTWGILRPVILLPETAREWPEALRRLVLLHELAHIRRGDVGFQLIGRLAVAAYWFHPLAWYAMHRMRVECECACDDHVVHAGGRRTDYARQLVDLARSLRASARIAAVSMVRENTLEHRIKTLFDEGRSHRPLSHRLEGALFAGALAVMIGLAVVHPGASATVAPAPVNPPAVTQDPALPQTYTYPITITGRAVDLDGKPVAGARIYLASRRADYKRVAETVADAEGRYAFRDVELPIERANTVNGRDEGAFQVFGEAEGFGFAWRPQKWFYPLPRPPSITYEPEWRDPPGRYEANDKIELDLRFPPAARFSGTVVDDQGNALAGVRLEIRDCESLTFVDNVRPGWTLDALNELDSAPPSMKIRTTDAAGRFEFTGMPENCRFRIHVRAKGFPDRWIHAATTREPQPPHDGGPVFTGDFKLTLTTPVDVPIKMVYGDTREPAPRVAVQAVEGLVNILRTTDDQGRVTLTLPPGHYRMENWPARGTPYLVTEDRAGRGGQTTGRAGRTRPAPGRHRRGRGRRCRDRRGNSRRRPVGTHRSRPPAREGHHPFLGGGHADRLEGESSHGYPRQAPRPGRARQASVRGGMAILPPGLRGGRGSRAGSRVPCRRNRAPQVRNATAAVSHRSASLIGDLGSTSVPIEQASWCAGRK